MRKLISFNMMTLDGYFEGPNGDIAWHNADNEEFNKFAIEQTDSFGVLLFGRVTYQMMAGYWPTPDAMKNDPLVASQMNSIPKVVFSRTLPQADWNNTRLVKDHIEDEVMKLKQQPGKDLALFGSANLLATLTNLGLVDEHRVMINPVVLTSGTPLFKGVKNVLKLKLSNTKVFASGNVLLCYGPVKE